MKVMMNDVASVDVRRDRQRGVSLIELMVALVIAALLGIGLVQIFGSTRAAFNVNSALARAQENSRFAVDFLQKDLRMVAHLGTRNEQSARPKVVEDMMENNLYNHLASAADGRPDSAAWYHRLHVPVEGFDFTGTGIGDTYELPEPLAGVGTGWSPALPTELSTALSTNKALAGSDILVLRFLDARYVTLINTEVRPDGIPTYSHLDPFSIDDTADSAEFLWDSSVAGTTNYVEKNGIYALSNISAISLFQVTDVEDVHDGIKRAVINGGLNNRGWGATTRPRNGLGGFGNDVVYGFMTPAHRYRMVVYYVALGANDEPALHRMQLSDDGEELRGAEELVPGVESMQVVYGVANVPLRQSDQPLVYLTADDIAGGSWATPVSRRWADVVNIRVGLVMRGEQSAAGESALSVEVLNTKISPPDADRRFRQVYELQASLRNRSRG